MKLKEQQQKKKTTQHHSYMDKSLIFKRWVKLYLELLDIRTTTTYELIL